MNCTNVGLKSRVIIHLGSNLAMPTMLLQIFDQRNDTWRIGRWRDSFTKYEDTFVHGYFSVSKLNNLGYNER